MKIATGLVIDESLIDESFVQASGPGGQNVNKVATAVQLRIDIARADMPFGMRERLAKLAGRKLSKDGVLIIVSQRFRTQERNRADARERLAALFAEAAIVPKIRRATRPSKAAKEKRRSDKAARSRVKRERTRRSED